MSALLKAWLKPNPLTEDPDDYNATISGMGSMDLDDIVLNEPSRLMLLIPDTLEAGEYEMIFITQFTKSSFLLKSPRTYTYQHPQHTNTAGSVMQEKRF